MQVRQLGALPALPRLLPPAAGICTTRGGVCRLRLPALPPALPSLPLAQVESVDGNEVVCEAKNSAVLDGMLTVFHQERSEDGLSNLQVGLGVCFVGAAGVLSGALWTSGFAWAGMHTRFVGAAVVVRGGAQNLQVQLFAPATVATLHMLSWCANMLGRHASALLVVGGQVEKVQTLLSQWKKRRRNELAALLFCHTVERVAHGESLCAVACLSGYWNGGEVRHFCSGALRRVQRTARPSAHMQAPACHSPSLLQLLQNDLPALADWDREAMLALCR